MAKDYYYCNIFNISYLRTFLKVNRKKRFDFVFTNDRFCSFIAYFAKKFLKIDTLTLIHDNAFFRIPVLNLRSFRAFVGQMLKYPSPIKLFDEHVYRSIPLQTVSKYSSRALSNHKVIATPLWERTRTG